MPMRATAPHIVQYQGSKRILAPQILRYMPRHCGRMIEPFSGTAAMTIAAALCGRSSAFVVNDLNAPLVSMLREAVEQPQRLLDDYSRLWNEQFACADGHISHFYSVRERFNSGDTSPANMLYLLARCVKGSVRYGRNGNFNQSPDKRRHGTSPTKLQPNLFAVSALLKGRATFSSLDYREVFHEARKGDLIYMDPPYQGVSDVRDNRYFSGVPFAEFAESLYELNRKGIDYLISYDGACGEKGYGVDLPEDLQCKKYMLCAGLSTQATFLGRREQTMEALYVSRGLSSSIPAAEMRQCESAQATIKRILHLHLNREP